jgi:hypothetical protein
MGCGEDLEAAAELGRRNGAARQRRAADELGVTGIAGALADAYASLARHGAIRSGAAPSAG